MCHILFIHSSIDRHVGCFHISAIWVMLQLHSANGQASAVYYTMLPLGIRCLIHKRKEVSWMGHPCFFQWRITQYQSQHRVGHNLFFSFSFFSFRNIFFTNMHVHYAGISQDIHWNTNLFDSVSLLRSPPTANFEHWAGLCSFNCEDICDRTESRSHLKSEHVHGFCKSLNSLTLLW